MTITCTVGRLNDIYDLDDLLNQFSISLRNHSRRVAVCSAIIAEYADAYINFYNIPEGISLPVIAHMGGTCHDIGKLMIPAINANDDDYRRHPELGAEMLEAHQIDFLGDDPSAQMILDIVRYHHEQTDGEGFPGGLRAKDIPLIAGICSVADKLDHNMYLKNMRSGDDAKVFKMIGALAGRHFCECTWVCVKCAWPRLVEKYATWNHFTGNYGWE